MLCYFPGITQYHQQLGDYPECGNVSSFEEFKFWHEELYKYAMKYNDLQKLKDECGEPCHTQKYIITDTFKEKIEKSKLSKEKSKKSTQSDLDNVTTGRKTVKTLFKNVDDTGKMVNKIGSKYA